MEPSEKEVNDAIEKMQKTLEKMDRCPRAAALISKNDQLGAELRDMNEEEWETAVRNMVETTPMTESEVRNWFGRLSGKCDPSDAAWTGL